MNKIHKIVCGIFISLIMFSFLFLGKHIEAKDYKDNWTLHEKTKIYSSNNDDYFNGCEDFDNYKSLSPGITVLTHGLGGDASHWSNNTNSYTYLSDNESSLIHKIAKLNNYNIDVYVAECDKDSQTDFKLTKYSITS